MPAMPLSATLRLTLQLLRKLALAGGVVLLLATSMASTSAWPRTVLDLDVQQQPVALKDWGDFWIDSTGQMTAAQVFAASTSQWQPTQPNAIYPLTSGQALWIRFTVPPAPDAERWYLEVP